VSDAIELTRALGRLPAQLEVYAIEGESFAAGDRLSPAVERAVEELAARLGARR
jgi:hydrogenase maturation protease